jgi:UDP-N-acetylglucosamine--N-acetylmuramyl-(pentapeptide) pyrophosphoryl-undecaprenol N-acetylglucosamine transferase
MIAITGGGTGGHLAIVRALKESLLEHDEGVIFIGSEQGQDRMWFENDHGFVTTHFLNTRGVMNQSFFGKIISLIKIIFAIFRSIKIFKYHNIDKVISVGGFSAAPAAIAAVLTKRKLFIHEQNAATGRLNGLLRPYAKRFYSSYDDEASIKDYPVQSIFFENARIREHIKTVVFLGGSQGAKAINSLALELTPWLVKEGYNVIHQCGEYDYGRVKTTYFDLGVDDKVELYAFTKKMPELLARSDFAISRAGASTLWELCASAIPTLFIPYPYAASDHQAANARFLVDKKAGYMLREGDLNINKIQTMIQGDNHKVSKNLKKLIANHGAKKIVEDILHYE